MPAFPDPFITDDDVILAQSAEQNIANFLESGNDYTGSYASARAEVIAEIKRQGGDPDLVTTPSDFKKAAVFFFLADLFLAERDFEKSEAYRKEFVFAVRRALAIGIDEEGGGQVGRITAECHGSINVSGFGKPMHYRRRRVNRRFG